MITKSILAMSLLLTVGAGSVAFAGEAPENKIGDRYPLLEQTYRPASSGGVTARRNTMWQAPKHDQYTNENPENKIGDRYPLLEQSIRFSDVRSKATRAMRQVKPYTFAEKAMFDHESARVVF